MSTLSGRGSGEPEVGEPDAETSGEEEVFSRDDAYEILANHRRRYAIHYLQHNGAEAELGALAEHVAAWENGTPVEGISSDERKRAYTSLQQFHLPKMDEKNVVRFDERAGTVELTDRAANMEVYFEVVSDYDVPWSLYYLGLALTGGALSVLSLLDVGAFGSIPTAAWAVFLVVSLGVSALAHTWVTYRNQLGRGERPPEVN